MKDKNVAKKYLIAVSALFVVLFVITSTALWALLEYNKIALDSVSDAVWIGALSAYLPCASFTGFCLCFFPFIKKDPSKQIQILLVVFFPIALAVITLIGIVMLIPTFLYEIIVALKKGL